MRKVSQDPEKFEGFFPATSMPDEDWWRMLWPRPDLVLERLGLRSGMTAVDLCCGYGWFTLPMVRLLGAERVIAIDIDPDMIAAAKAYLAAAGVRQCRWITGCAQEMDRLIPAASCDFVLIANTYHGVPDKTGLIEAVHRVLKPEGLFAIVNWHRRPREKTPVLGRPRGPASALRMRPEDVEATLRQAARERAAPFLRDKLVELPPYHYGIVFRKG
jgi:ubiquinone/menaquinone biosynthesis C-methylase UbiE